jgi:hypothetical protein
MAKPTDEERAAMHKAYMDPNKQPSKNKQGAYPQPVGSRQSSRPRTGMTIGEISERHGREDMAKVRETVRHKTMAVTQSLKSLTKGFSKK